MICIHEFGDEIIGRFGLPYHERGVSIITLVVDTSVERVSALTGKLGKLPGIQVRSLLSKSPSQEPNMLPKVVSEGLTDFIPAERIEQLLRRSPAEAGEVRPIIAKSMRMERLELEEMAALLSVTDPALLEEMFDAARELKKNVYGNRIVLFAPLYIGNKCVNSACTADSGTDNDEVVRRTLDRRRAARRSGRPRQQGPQAPDPRLRRTSRLRGRRHRQRGRRQSTRPRRAGEIRRVNINCAPLDVEGFRTMKEVGIGTYQIFQETYHRATYAKMHPTAPSATTCGGSTALDRAMEAGCDDVGHRRAVRALRLAVRGAGPARHAIHLEEPFGVGPHTISLPAAPGRGIRGVNSTTHICQRRGFQEA